MKIIPPYLPFLITCFMTACFPTEHEPIVITYDTTGVALVVLGTIQDAGSPQIGCDKPCCENLFVDPDPGRQITSLGLIDKDKNQKWMFEASPDITYQTTLLSQHVGIYPDELPDGIFLTHAHIGHYTGLMSLGKEAISASTVPVYAMPRMREFLTNNGPWSQLVADSNISLHGLEDSTAVQLNENIKVTPFLVPHRDEYSETVGFRIEGPNKSALFIPDINKWSAWSRSIVKEVAQVDYAFLDGTFYNGEELPNRDMSEVPHPFIVETMELFKETPKSEKEKIYFIHFNHTNPVIDPFGLGRTEVTKHGYKIAGIEEVVKL